MPVLVLLALGGAFQGEPSEMDAGLSAGVATRSSLRTERIVVERMGVTMARVYNMTPRGCV